MNDLTIQSTAIGIFTADQVCDALLNHTEIALIDVREEAVFAKGHPLFAANLPLSRLETEVCARFPNKVVSMVVYDDGEGLAVKTAEKLIAFGYKNVNLLDGGLEGWRVAGKEIFEDVNSPSKAFGELVEFNKHTPSLSAQQVKELIDTNADIVVLDARRFDEYNTMSIPSGISVPGAELVFRAKELAPANETTVIVNCAGRTRSIIGTQSLVNAGIPNPVYALRNGTIGWTLAGQALEHGQSRFFKPVGLDNEQEAIIASRKVADRAGVKRTSQFWLTNLINDGGRTNYCFDVRTPDEYIKGHLPGFIPVPGGQLVQETDHFAPVRGARILLADDKAVRANMTASWLAQMGWDVYVIDEIKAVDLIEKGSAPLKLLLLPAIKNEQLVSAATLQEWLNKNDDATVIDLATAALYLKQHIPGAWFVLRSQLSAALKNLPEARRYVLTSPDGILAKFVLPELQALTSIPVFILNGGTKAWLADGYPLVSGDVRAKFASPQTDRYRRPYEGTNNSAEAMQAYLDWEYGLVDQLDRDGTHGFFVI